MYNIIYIIFYSHFICTLGVLSVFPSSVPHYFSDWQISLSISKPTGWPTVLGQHLNCKKGFS